MELLFFKITTHSFLSVKKSPYSISNVYAKKRILVALICFQLAIVNIYYGK